MHSNFYTALFFEFKSEYLKSLFQAAEYLQIWVLKFRRSFFQLICEALLCRSLESLGMGRWGGAHRFQEIISQPHLDAFSLKKMTHPQMDWGECLTTFFPWVCRLSQVPPAIGRLKAKLCFHFERCSWNQAFSTGAETGVWNDRFFFGRSSLWRVFILVVVLVVLVVVGGVIKLSSCRSRNWLFQPSNDQNVICLFHWCGFAHNFKGFGLCFSGRKTSMESKERSFAKIPQENEKCFYVCTVWRSRSRIWSRRTKISGTS